MIYIIEGVDGTGKTSFAKKLAEENNATYLHADKPIYNNWFKEYIEPVKEKNMVLDRWHVGEIVWPKLFNRESLFNDETFDLCNFELSKRNAQLIILTRSDDDIVKELTIRNEIDQIEIVLKAKVLFLKAYTKIKYIDKKIVESNVFNVYRR